jgi:hypothetical protein
MTAPLPIDMDELHEEAIAYGCSLDQEAEIREMLPEDFDEAPGVRRVKARLRMGRALLSQADAEAFVAAGDRALHYWRGSR